MPTLSASDYTQYLKFKAATVTPISPAIQTRSNVALSQSVINANLLTSQAALVSTPFTATPVVSPVTVTGASATTVTDARSTLFTTVVGGSGVITYTTVVPHGLGETGATVSVIILGISQNTLTTSPNSANSTDAFSVTITGASTFTKSASGVGGAATPNTGRIVGRVYYTTNVVHGLTVGDTVTIANLTTFPASNATVLAVPSTTQFVLSSTTTGTTETGASGSLSGFVYYTTSAAHDLAPSDPKVRVISVSGLSAFNLSLGSVFQSVSATVFRVQSDATGTAVTGGSGVLTVTTYTNNKTAITTNARVQAQQVVQTRATPTAKATLSFAGTSGALGSSVIQRPGGLPTGFKNSQGSYTRLPQQAGW
jgi:hypothetical protein